MNLPEKIKWLEDWCTAEGLQLILEGECGFGRECVGVASLNDGTYPDYNWYDDDYTRIDKNGDVWTPENVYHKHPCTAVLGRGEGAVSELFIWCKWFHENGFYYEDVPVNCINSFELMLGRDHHHRMVKGQV